MAQHTSQLESIAMPFASIRGQEIFYEDTGGAGPVVLLAHGYLMDQSMFVHQVRVLAPQFRVVTWDERAFGQTKWDKKPFTYWDSAADAIALLDHLGVDRAIVGGMSQGGFLSLRAALLAPERIQGLVLLSTQAGVDPPAAIAGYRQMMDTWVNVGPIDPLVETIAGIILGTDRSQWEPWVTRWRAIPKEDMLQPTLCLLERDDITGRLGEITAPAIAFHGNADHGVPIERGRAMAAALRDCRGFVEVDGAAHAANLTHPEAVNARLLEFCRAVAGLSPSA
jgi:3-oxoadipate enol-lactonase